MKIRHLLQASVLASAALVQQQAAAQDGPARWVTADSVLVRATPEASGAVVGKLNRGAQVVLTRPEEVQGYCFVEGEGETGYAACKFLSADRIERARAGENGIDAAQRWIAGNGVTVRAAPKREAEVAGRLSLNAVVKQIGEAGNGYCEVQSSSGVHGYTACRYLVPTPVVLGLVVGQAGSGEVSAEGYDPVRAFWLDPGWSTLDAYARYLRSKHSDIPWDGPWPRDDDLERMKAHLALGINGVKPVPYPDWVQAKRIWIEQDQVKSEIALLQKDGKAVPGELARKERLADSDADKLVRGNERMAYIPASPLNAYASSNTPLLKKLDFPAVQPSLFRSHLELASGDAVAADAGGRFGIVYRQVTKPRPKFGPNDSNPLNGVGLYDMQSVTQSLVKPVQHVRVFRDGKLSIERSFMRSTALLWDDTDAEGCAGWFPGFLHGDADSALWKLSGYANGSAGKDNPNPPGSLYEFYTTRDLPGTPAAMTTSEVKLDAKATGFSSGTYLIYDLDGDGIPDLAVWEGKGTGPGAVALEGTPNDRWFRLVLVNIDGAWKMLGSDQFGYGCGC